MPPEAERRGGERKPPSCPICGRPSAEETRPFCSKRCRDVDLNRWFSGHYVIPGSDTDEEGKD
jgi:uncharacterized protein